MSDQSDGLMKVSQFARMAKTSTAWAYNKIKSRELRSVRLPGGRLLRIPSSELKKLQPDVD
jgi:hypothetical protein